jgi:hypothetical protein
MELWPCDSHLKTWNLQRKQKLTGKRKRNSDNKKGKEVYEESCRCAATVERSRCVQFFNATRSLWPMLWKDHSLRLTVAACEQHHGLQPLGLDEMDPNVAYQSFFNLAHGSLWSGVPVDVDEYWRYQRLRPLLMDLSRPLHQSALISWHTLACNPAGTLAVALNEEACRRRDFVLYMWVPIVPTNNSGSIYWPCHYGTVLMTHRDWNSREEFRQAWMAKSLQSKYEWCRASDQQVDDQAKVLSVPLLRFKDDQKRNLFIRGKTMGGGKRPCEESEALKPAPPFLLQHRAMDIPRFAESLERLRNATRISDLGQLHQRCMREWRSHAKVWHGTLAGLLSAHETMKKHRQGCTRNKLRSVDNITEINDLGDGVDEKTEEQTEGEETEEE